MHVHLYAKIVKKGSDLVRAANSVCTDFRQADIVELAFLYHFIEYLGIVFDFVVRVASRRFE